MKFQVLHVFDKTLQSDGPADSFSFHVQKKLENIINSKTKHRIIPDATIGSHLRNHDFVKNQKIFIKITKSQKANILTRV